MLAPFSHNHLVIYLLILVAIEPPQIMCLFIFMCLQIITIIHNVEIAEITCGILNLVERHRHDKS